MRFGMSVCWSYPAPLHYFKADQIAAGFFYVKNFNISQEEVDQQFALGREFYSLPLEEKLKFHNVHDLESGEYNGYRPAGHRV